MVSPTSLLVPPLPRFSQRDLPKILCSLWQMSFRPTEPQTSSSLRPCWNLVNLIRRCTPAQGRLPARIEQVDGDAHKRRFDIVCVWRFDRFARSVSHLLRALETFKALGIDFVSYSEQMDTSTPAGKMVFTVLGAVAELERSLIVERVRAG